MEGRKPRLLQLMSQGELSCPNLGKELLLKGNFYEAEMHCIMIVGYNLLMEMDSGVLSAQDSMTL